MSTTPRNQSTQPSTISGATEHSQATRARTQQRVSNMNNNTGSTSVSMLSDGLQDLAITRDRVPGGRRRRRRRRSSKRRKSRKSKRKRKRRRRKRTKKKRRRRR